MALYPPKLAQLATNRRILKGVGEALWEVGGGRRYWKTFFSEEKKSFPNLSKKSRIERHSWLDRYVRPKMPFELRVFFGEARRTIFLQKNGSPEFFSFLSTPLPFK
jgi:hypothetical protein